MFLSKLAALAPTLIAGLPPTLIEALLLAPNVLSPDFSPTFYSMFFLTLHMEGNSLLKNES
jgi:hypothetical protein